MEVNPQNVIKVARFRKVYVVWVECGPWFKPPLNKRNIFIGFCGYTGKPFTITTNPLYPILVRDIFVDNDCQGTCEEAYRCICTSCPKK